ncbi:MAG: alkaline phosphatase PhoX [Actinomycetota bacterium]
MVLDRRRFLARSGQVGMAVSLLGAVDALLTAPGARAQPAGFAGYGPLVEDPDGRLALPEGFSYRVVTEAGTTRMKGGEPSPGIHDGAAAFDADDGDGNVLVVLNHEVRGGPDDDGAVPHEAGLVYRDDAGGGCTIIKTTGEGELIWERVGLAGTSTNCAGGVTPWGTWLTCEETEDDRHGYVFEVNPHDLDANQDPTPITALGRFVHEALCIDPDTLAVYLTEDTTDPLGTVYRWTPPSDFRGRPGELATLDTDAGELAALVCTDDRGARVDDLAQADEVNTTYQVEWAPVEDRGAENGPLRAAEGITRAHKLEGAWWADGGAYLVSSYADSHRGQIWHHDPAAETLRLTTVFGTDADGETVEAPDNIVAAPYGGLILATDGETDNHLAGVTRDGAVYPLARSQIGSEFTGPAFSPDGRVLFAGIQKPGILFAITGPWQESAPAPSSSGSGSRPATDGDTATGEKRKRGSSSRSETSSSRSSESSRRSSAPRSGSGRSSGASTDGG